MTARTIEQGADGLICDARRGGVWPLDRVHSASSALSRWLTRPAPVHGAGPLVMRIEGKRYRACDCSPGGFRLAHYHRELKPRDRIEGLARTGLFGASRSFVAEVVRASPSGGAALRFIEVSSDLLNDLSAGPIR